MLYIMSDVHGNLTKWEKMKKLINLGNDDTLIVIGDVIDRNYGGIHILQEILSKDNMITLMGNHELMMIDALTYPDDKTYMKNWFTNGGDVTFKELSGLPNDDKESLIQSVRELPMELEVQYGDKRIRLTHAAPRETFPNSEYRWLEDHMVWDRTSFNNPINIGCMFIFGHTPVQLISNEFSTSEIIKFDHDWYDIDCGACYPFGKLACLRIDDMQEFYV